MIRPGLMTMTIPDELTSPAETTIRPAEASDAAVIAQLLDQLGYPTDADEVAARLERLSTSAADQVLVAQRGRQVLAVASIHFMDYFHRGELLCKITAFVVKEDCRGQGIGSALLCRIEQIARERGCQRMELTSALDRRPAHAFYQGKGYKKAGFKFYKPLK